MKKPWRPEPATVTVTVATWSFLTAFSFVVSGPAILLRSSFAILHQMNLPFYVWLVCFIFSGFSLLGCLYIRSLPYRATTAMFAALFWILVGGANIASLANIGFLGSFGLWSIFCGLSCLHAVSQWAFYDE